MNGYDLAASLFQSLTSLAWPAAAAASVYFFRDRVSELLPRLHLKHKETEISFQIEAAKVEAQQLPSPSGDTPVPADEERQKLLNLARISPKGAILAAWSDFEVRLRDLAKSHHELGDFTSKTSALTIMRGFRSSGQIGSPIFQLFNDLRTIRNQTAHEDFPDGINVEDAVEFQRLTERVLQAVEEVPSQDEKDAAATTTSATS
ncbi:MAG: hypothetical protein KJ947_11540 [Alphaproteobacteria bacterium]|nr:hypothetical protein [Alphaproteobacteria bacterium]MBU1550189.1 hypothetical protein [Alphaproteobacteria bacterium]MBU2337890.1 hypothetical protein [Alphaproteobacteria bacterium]MBU2387870.1 hypothetical protein [Alphaproteobacteria bacterium]